MLWGVQGISVVVLIIMAPLVLGITQVVKARLQGRRGPSLWWGYWVLAKTWGKETTVPEYSSWIFRVAPSISLAAMILVAGTIPWAGRVPNSWPHDLLTLFFLLALERFWVGLAGLDSAGTFGGLGSSRITTLGAGIEPALFAAFGVLWAVSGCTTISTVVGHLSLLPWGMAAVSYGLVMLAELGRLPIDNVDTHLELTMMHEATVLEYNGRLLAENQAAIAVKYTAMLGLGWVWLSPSLESPWITAVLHLSEIMVTAAIVGGIESRFAKLRYFQIPTYLAMASGLGLLAFYLMMTGGLN